MSNKDSKASLIIDITLSTIAWLVLGYLLAMWIHTH